MDNYALRIKIEMPDGELEKILNELSAAQDTIYKCYSRLRELGFVTITEKPTAATVSNSN